MSADSKIEKPFQPHRAHMIQNLFRRYLEQMEELDKINKSILDFAQWAELRKDKDLESFLQRTRHFFMGQQAVLKQELYEHLLGHSKEEQ